MAKQFSEKFKNKIEPAVPLSPKKKRKPYRKPIVVKHADIQMWAFGTMGG